MARARRVRRAHRSLRTLVWLALLGAAVFALYAWSRAHPEDVPWTALDLAQPIGLFTGRKLAALSGEPDRCHALLTRAGVRYVALPVRRESPQCGYDDGIRFGSGGAVRISYGPARLGTACPVAAALALLEWQVVQPAARKRFGSKVVTIEHFGSFNCRRMYGRDSGAWSEHATANAVDIAGFILADGRRITIARNWDGKPDEQAFLRDVRDGACRLFSTVLSPDYNAAHHDHLHLDEANRGATGWRACR